MLLAFILTVIGAIAAVVATFLSAADISVEFPIAGNTLVQHADGAIIIGLALLATLFAGIPAFSQKPNLNSLIPVFLCGGVIIAIAVMYGTNLPIEPNNRLSAAILERNPPTAGAGVWAAAIGGALIVVASIFGIATGKDGSD